MSVEYGKNSPFDKTLESFADSKLHRSNSILMELFALLVLLAVGFIWWGAYIYFPLWTPDGNTYQSAIDLVIQGRSPYEHYVFPYPPTIAVLGAWITGLFGSDSFRTGFRYVNLLGGFLAIWGSLFVTRWPLILRFILAIAGIILLPSLRSGIENDNLSMLTSGTTILALLFFKRVPVLSGIVLGFGLALKPVALIAFFLILAHRPLSSYKKQLQTCVSAVITSALLLSTAPGWFLSGFFHPNVTAAVSDWVDAVINVSLYRVFACFGIRMSPFLFLAIILFLSLLYVRKRHLNQVQLLCTACSATLLSLPIVWKHTLLMVLPVLCVALSNAFGVFWKEWKRPAKGREDNRNRLKSLSYMLIVVAGCITVMEANGYGVLGNWQAPFVNGTMLMVPITLLLLLTRYVVRFGDEVSCASREHPPGSFCLPEEKTEVNEVNAGQVPLVKVSIVIPVYNEAGTLEELLGKVLSSKYRKEIILVDDNSTDGTRDILEKARNSKGGVSKILYHEKNAGKGAALRTGFEHVTGDVVIIQDADLELDPDEYPVLLKPILEGRADVVYGSRFLKRERGGFSMQYAGNRLLTWLSNLFTGLGLSDMETGYKVFSREVLGRIDIKSNRFGFEPEFTAKVARNRFRVFEVPVSYDARDYDKGKKIMWWDGITAVAAIIWFSFND